MATIFWKSGVNGLFNDPASWLGGIVPGGLDTADLLASGVYTVTVPASAVVANFGSAIGATLAVSAGTFRLLLGASHAGKINVAAGASLEASGVFASTGSVNLAGSNFVVDGALTLNGNGRINLSGGASVVADDFDGGALTNRGQTIQGAGQIGAGDGALTFVNASGAVIANSEGQTLTLSTGATVLNTGLLRASDGGTLDVRDVVNNAGGVISEFTAPGLVLSAINLRRAVSGGIVSADGGRIDIYAPVTGAVLRAVNGAIVADSSSPLSNDIFVETGGAQFQFSNITLAGDTFATADVFGAFLSNVTLDGATTATTIQAGAQVALVANTGAKLIGSLVDRGVLALNPSLSGNTSLDIDGSVTVSGNGRIRLNSSEAGYSVIYGDGTDHGVLTNSGVAIGGAGQIGYGDRHLRFINSAGAVVADLADQTLTVTTGGVVTNSALMAAEAGARLLIYDAVKNAGGVIDAKGHVVANGLINGGTVQASASGGVADINASATGVNAKASAGGVVNLNGGTFGGGLLSATGVGSAVELYNGVIVSGAQLTTSAGGVVGVHYGWLDSTAGAVGIAAGARVLVHDNGALVLAGPILNEGRIDIGETADTGYSTMYISGDVTLNGAGRIVLAGSPNPSWLVGDSSKTETLTNNGQTISGVGSIGSYGDHKLTLRNQAGAVNANVSGGFLYLDTGNTIVNQATLEATAGGILAIYDAVDNSAGRILALGSAVSLYGEVTGGTLKAQGANAVIAIANNGVAEASLTATAGAAIEVGNATLDDDVTGAGGAGSLIALNNGAVVKGGSLSALAGASLKTDDNVTLDGSLSPVTITAGTKLAVSDGASLFLKGEIDVRGEIDLGKSDNANYSQIFIQGATTLAAGGRIELNPANSFDWIRSTAGEDDSFTLTNQDIIEGAGNIGYYGDGRLTLDNEGTVNADIAGANLAISTGKTLANSGVLEATNGGHLYIYDKIDNSAVPLAPVGVVKALAGSAISSSGGIQGGLVEALGAGSSLSLSGRITGATVKTVGGRIDVQYATMEDDMIGLAGAAGLLTLGYQSFVAGGSLTTTAGAHIVADGATLNGLDDFVTIAAGTNVQIRNASRMWITGDIDNEGAITLGDADALNYTLLYVVGETTLTGPGAINLSAAGGNSQLWGDSTNHGRLVNQGNAIQGAGNIGIYGDGNLTLDNEAGVVNANTSGAVLSIQTGNVITNRTTMKASRGGELQIRDNLDNAGGLVLAEAGSTVKLFRTETGGTYQASGAGAALRLQDGSTIAGGTLLAARGGALTVDGNAKLDGVTTATTLSTGNRLQIQNGAALGLKGTILNKGEIDVGSSAYAYLYTSGPSRLSGGGKVKLQASADGYSFISGDSAAPGALTNADDRIEGAGAIGYGGDRNLTFVNEGGVVNANASGKTLEIRTGNQVTNTSLLEATAGGILQIDDDLDNTGGSVKALGGAVALYGKTTGGLVQAAGASSSLGLHGNLKGATLQVLGGALATARDGAIDDEITLVSGAGSSLSLDYNEIVVGGSLSTRAGGTLLDSYNATLDGTDDAVTLTAGSTLGVADGAALFLKGAIADVGEIDVGAATGADARIAGGVTLSGGGRLNLAAANGYSRLIAATGTGDDKLTNQGDTIFGAGRIGYYGDHNLTFDNARGAVRASLAGETLILSTGNAISNGGILEALGGADLAIDDSINNGAAGVINARADELNGAGIVALQNQTTTGGRLNALGGEFHVTNSTVSKARLTASGGGGFTFDGATLAGARLSLTDSGHYLATGGLTLDGSTTADLIDANVELDVSASLTLKGVIANQGRLIGAVEHTPAYIVAGAATLNGGGALELDDGGLFGDSALGGVLNNLNQTISGDGYIGGHGAALKLNNLTNGVIDANGPLGLTIATGAQIFNGGLMEAFRSAGLSTGGDLAIDDSIANVGVLLADGGHLRVGGALTGPGGVEIKNGGVAQLDSSSSNAVTFSGAGELVLNDAPHAAGLVNGFGIDDFIDFGHFASGYTTISRIAGTGAAGTVTTLTLTDSDPSLGAPMRASLKLFNAFDGQYGLVASDYALSADGTGGTLLQLAARA